MTQRKTDVDRVLDLVMEDPGLTDSCYRWKRGGGAVANGIRVGDIYKLTPEIEAKMSKVQQRLHELKGKRVVYQDQPAYKTDSPGLGYWPVGTIACLRPAGVPAMVASEKAVADHGRGRANIDLIKGVLR